MQWMRSLAKPGGARKKGERWGRIAAAMLPCSCLFAAGCQTDEAPTKLVNPSPFAQPAAPRQFATAAYTQASIDVVTRVDALGRKLLSQNPQIGFQPVFTAGVDPQPEIFHKGTSEIVITDGLVKKCNTDGELAAVLAHELGKMVAEQEALSGSVDPAKRRQAAPELRIGSSMGDPEDPLYLIERSKFDGKPRPRNEPPPLPPDPKLLARGYLKKAGFAETNLDGAESILKEAEKNSKWERQMKSAQTASWTKPGTR